MTTAHPSGEKPAPLADALESLLERYACACDPVALRAAVVAWEGTGAQLSREQRSDLLARVVARIERTELPGRALLPVALGDADGRIVAAAVTRLALVHRPDADDPEPGPLYVLKHALTAAASNLGAVLGALLGMGDAAVARWIFELRHLLAHPQFSAALEEMTRHPTGPVHKATVEFYLDWLDELAEDLPASEETFDRVANRLIDLRAHAASGHFIDDCLRHPPCVSYQEGSPRIPARELTRSIWSRLVTLDRAVRPSTAMRRVLEAWGPG